MNGLEDDSRSEDRLGSGSDTFFTNIPRETITHFFEWNFHNWFFAPYLCHQHKGTSMGGNLSAQICNMVLMIKEMKWSEIGLLECKCVQMARYTDNICTFGRVLLLYWSTVALIAFFNLCTNAYSICTIWHMHLILKGMATCSMRLHGATFFDVVHECQLSEYYPI